VGAIEILRRRERTITSVRWAVASFASIMLLPGVGPRAALAIPVIVVLVATNLVSTAVERRVHTAGARSRYAAVAMAADTGAAALYLVGVAAVDDSLSWGVLVLLVLEGALRYRFQGAVGTAVGSAALYAVVEQAIGQTGPAELVSRIVVLLLIGGFAGAITREMDAERRLYQRMAFASQDIATRRDPQVILQMLASHIADTLDAPVVAVHAWQDGRLRPIVVHRAARAAGEDDVPHPSDLLDDPATTRRVTWHAAEGDRPALLTLPVRLPERAADHVVAVRMRGQRPGALTEGALLSLAEASAVALATLDVIRRQESSNRRLERLEVLRTRFVATVAHDLRSPLTTVKGVASILRDRRDSVPAEHVDRMLESVQRQADRLNRLADDLLDAARLDSDKLELVIGEVDVVQLLQAVAADAADDVEVHADGPIHLIADGARLERVIWNLVSNALKYGRPPILLTADTDGDDVRLAVRDHGRGLTPEQTTRLFTEFAAGDDPDSVGLGLAIVWQLVAAHGGTVAYADADPGACFTVRIPSQSAVLAPALDHH
jgi:K+-sensing histidine kinase KdpD